MPLSVDYSVPSSFFSDSRESALGTLHELISGRVTSESQMHCSTTISLEKTMYHLAGKIHADVQSAIVGIYSAWRKADDRTLWQRIIGTATLQ